MAKKIQTHEYETREEYVDIQVERSQNKFEYCKVYFRDIFRYRQMLLWDLERRNEILKKDLNILCLGVRSGAEVDMFRTVFNSRLARRPWAQKQIISRDTTKIGDEKIKLSRRWGKFGGDKNKGKVWGVEINPDAARDDIWIGSFDELPQEWTNRFDILYTNSFDHSMNPKKVVAEWKRVAMPGAYAITGFSLGQDVSDHDPVAGLTFETIQELWQSPIVFASQTYNRNNYYEICVRIDK